MIKSIQTKIILIFFVIGIIVIGTLSFLHINSLKQLSESLVQNADVTLLNEQIIQTEVITIISIIIFAIITLLLGYYVSKSVTKPINFLIQSAEKIADGEELEINEIDNKKTEIDELVNAFSLMTKKLKQNLNEMGNQKKQIETILLHMTDGIIAFDMEGNIIHINPAAIELLNLSKAEHTFNEIFAKFDDINLEKIVYLERNV